VKKPRGLKPLSSREICGTAEAVPSRCSEESCLK
jgi:hypothetical protein